MYVYNYLDDRLDSCWFVCMSNYLALVATVCRHVYNYLEDSLGSYRLYIGMSIITLRIFLIAAV